MLTPQQITDARRWLGHPLLNAREPDTVYTSAWSRAGVPVSLTAKLAGLTASEEATLTTRFLAPLAQLEAALLGASDNLDTAVAGPWTANPNEVSARSRLYDQWRRDMAAFLGFAPGPSLGGGGMLTLSRC